MAQDGPDDWVSPTQTHPAESDGPNDWVTAPKPVNAAGDAVRSLGTGVMEGYGNLLGMTANVVPMIDKGSRHLLSKAAVGMGIMPQELADRVNQHLDENGETLAGLPVSALQSDSINRHLTTLAQKAGLDTSAPKTVWGDYAHTLGEFLPGSGFLKGAETTGQAIKQGLKYIAAPAVGSETLGQMTKGTSLETPARVVGAVVPGAAMSVLDRIANPVGTQMAKMTDAQATEAQSMLDASRQPNMAPLTTQEAIDTATNGATNLGKVARNVSQSPAGGQIMNDFYAQRPAQVEAMAKNTFDQISPPAANPYEVAPKVQAAAQNTMGQVTAARTAAVDPLYKAAATDQVPLDQMQGIIGKLDEAIAADKTGLIAPKLQEFKNSLGQTVKTVGDDGVETSAFVPHTDIGNLDTARKYWRDAIGQPSIAQDAIPKTIGSQIGSTLDDLKSTMEASSEKFAQGRGIYEKISNDIVNPLERAPLGQLAGADKFPEQAKILFNPNPLPGSERAVAQAVRQVAKSDPDTAQQMVRMQMEQMFNKAKANTGATGADQYAGPKFSAIVTGGNQDSQQMKNLEAAFRALPDGATRWAAMKSSLDIMDAMAKRPAVGSMTEFNRQVDQLLKEGHPGVAALATAASPGEWPTFIHKIYRSIAYGRNTAAYAKLFTDSDVKDLRALVGVRPNTLRAQAAFVGALGKRAVNTTQPQPQEQ